MKKILLILAITTLTFSCDTAKEPEVSYDDIHNCMPMPDDVPKTYAGGTPIEWDCQMAAYYYNGDLVFHYNDDGGLIAIEKID